MKRLYQLLKKDILVSTAVCSCLAAGAWFYISPGGFQSYWVKNPVVGEIIKQHNEVEHKYKILSIKYYYPYFNYFAAIAAGGQPPRADLIDSYFSGQPFIFRTYYQKVIQMFPENDAGHALLGFCEYYKGDLDAASAEYRDAIGLNPYFFWSYYNLGVIDFQKGRFLHSAQVLSRALSLDRAFTLELVHENSFYGQIWHYIIDPTRVVEANLIQGQQDAALLIAVYLVKAGQFDQALQLVQSMQGRRWHQEFWQALYQKAINRQSDTSELDRLIDTQIPVRIF